MFRAAAATLHVFVFKIPSLRKKEKESKEIKRKRNVGAYYLIKQLDFHCLK